MHFKKLGEEKPLSRTSIKRHKFSRTTEIFVTATEEGEMRNGDQRRGRSTFAASDNLGKFHLFPLTLRSGEDEEEEKEEDEEEEKERRKEVERGGNSKSIINFLFFRHIHLLFSFPAAYKKYRVAKKNFLCCFERQTDGKKN